MARKSLRDRRQQRLSRKKKPMTLNIISLIDIFTVLVFFLLLNSTELELLPEANGIRLPESLAEGRARETIVVMVSNNDILVQGASVAKVGTVMASDARTIPALKAALLQQISSGPAAATSPSNISPEQLPAPRELTIMGDRDIPYRLLKKVLATCTESEFGALSLAVLQKSGPAPKRPQT